MTGKTLLNTHQNKLHHLAQLLAAYGASYLPDADDHSQTNLGWNIAKSALISRSYKDIHLELEYPGLMLFLVHKDKKYAFDPLGATLSDADHWIRETLSEHGVDPTRYSRDMGFQIDSPEDVFISLDNDDEKILLQLTEERNIAQKALDNLKNKLPSTTSEIRIWPHLFDTGMLIYPESNNKGKGFSLGYAPADALSEVPYFYASAWSDREIDYNDLPQLPPARWHLDSWKGAMIPVDQALDLKVVTRFYEDFISVMTHRI